MRHYEEERQAAEQAEAARALGKIGTKAAQKLLIQAIDKLAPPNDPVALTSRRNVLFLPVVFGRRWFR